jgi:hypothetical protein
VLLPSKGQAHARLQLAGVGDDARLLGFALVIISVAHGLNSLDHFLALDDLPKNAVHSIKPRRHDSGDEELRAVGVFAGVGHGEKERAVVLQLKILILKGHTIDTLAASAVASGEVTTLEHEVGDYPVERRALVVERPTKLCRKNCKVFQ